MYPTELIKYLELILKTLQDILEELKKEGE